MKVGLGLGFIGLLIFAAALGFAADFSNCFGRSSCSNGAGGYLFIFPLAVAVIGFLGWRKWREERAERYHDQVRHEVRREMNLPPSRDKTAPITERILRSFNGSEKLTIEDLMQRTGLDKDQVLAAIRQLLPSRIISQKIVDNVAYFRLQDKNKENLD